MEKERKRERSENAPRYPSPLPLREGRSCTRSCRSLSTCLSCDQSSASPVRVRRPVCRCALDFTRFLPAGCRVHMHTRTRAITHDLLLAHHSLREHEKIGRSWTWSNERGGSSEMERYQILCTPDISAHPFLHQMKKKHLRNLNYFKKIKINM